MTVISKYPVFEADQLLSQSHLNSIVSYFETQDRTTRKGLIGIGIVCGLDISFPSATQIKIGCGTAVTSLGFQINWDEKTFSKYKLVDKLSEAFITPNYIQEPFLNSIFKYSSLYDTVAFTNFEELIEEPVSKVKSISKNSKKALEMDNLVSIKALDSEEKRIPNARFLDGKVIVLLLEVSLIDQKKCSETNCDDKGKRMEFNLRPILINASKIDSSSFVNSSLSNTFEPLYLGRFNAPEVSLYNGQQVLNSFVSLAHQSQVIDQMDLKIKKVYTSFQDGYFTSIKDYATLANVRVKINEVIRTNRAKLHVQYLWDWVNDIAAAYNEILVSNEKSCFSFCCLSEYESKFPFHVFLGKIETQGSIFATDDFLFEKFTTPAGFIGREYNVLSEDQKYISPWIKVSNKHKKEAKLALKLLLERLVLLLNNFSVLTADTSYLDSSVKVTPSYLGDYPLSKKAIPYYYNQIPALNKVWNPKATIKKATDKILSYHADKYSSVASTVYPLNYDLEPYNFLRVEGIIGKSYKQVLQSLLTIRKNSQLPFNVVAINAINLDKVVLNMSSFLGEWDDIELDYDLVSRNWENVIGKSIEWFEANALRIAPYFDIKRKSTKQVVVTQVSFSQFIKLLKQGRDSMVVSFSDFIKIYDSFIVIYEKIEEIASQMRKYLFDTLQNNEDELFAEDLIDHFDQMIFVCQKGEFRALNEAAQTQWEKTSKELTLSKFIEKHPGMTHKCGVPFGGTLVLVYQDTSIIPKKFIQHNFNAVAAASNATANTIATAASNPKERTTASSKIGVKTDLKATTKTSAVASDVIAKNSTVFEVSLEEYKKKIQAYAAYYLPATSYNHLINYMDNLLSTTINQDLYGIPNEALLADFYLPYLCCSEGDAINFILNATIAGPADFDGSDFNSNDFLTNKTIL